MDVHKHFFSQRVVDPWNLLPEETQNAKSATQFHNLSWNILSKFDYKKKEEIIDERKVVEELNNLYFTMDRPSLLEVIYQVKVTYKVNQLNFSDRYHSNLPNLFKEYQTQRIHLCNI